MLECFTASQIEIVRAKPRKHAGVVIACCGDRTMSTMYRWNIWKLVKIYEIVKTKNANKSKGFLVVLRAINAMPFLFDSNTPHLQTCCGINQKNCSIVRIHFLSRLKASISNVLWTTFLRNKTTLNSSR